MTDFTEYKPMLRYQAMQDHENFKATEAVLQAIGALTALNDNNRFDRLVRELEVAAMSLQRAYPIRGPIERHLFSTEDMA